jgi:hypothetical protein
MAAMETNLDELLGVIARQTIVLNRQDNAITEMTNAYNTKAAECDKLQEELTKALGELAKKVD